MCPNENKRSLAEVSEANKMIPLPGLTIKIVNEKKARATEIAQRNFIQECISQNSNDTNAMWETILL